MRGGENPANLEEQALSLVGRDIFEKLVKGYTEKQWGRDCKELPASIIRRLPVRFTYDNNYFNDRWQGIPMGGYTAMVERMFGDMEILLDTEYKGVHRRARGRRGSRDLLRPHRRVLDYKLGNLEYRSLRFESEKLDCENWQGNAVVNYTEREVPFTRIIEHKHFEFGRNAAGETIPTTVITRDSAKTRGRRAEPPPPPTHAPHTAFYEEYGALAGGGGVRSPPRPGRLLL